MDRLLQNLRLGTRSLSRTPGFALTAILTLALGIGLATAVFTVADALLLRRLPVRDQDRLVVLWGQAPDRTYNYPSRSRCCAARSSRASSSTCSARGPRSGERWAQPMT